MNATHTHTHIYIYIYSVESHKGQITATTNVNTHDPTLP